MNEYKLKISVSDIARLLENATLAAEELIEHWEAPLSDLVNEVERLARESYDENVVADDKEFAWQLWLRRWRDAVSSVAERAKPRECDVVVLPDHFELPVLNDNGGVPDGTGAYIVPVSALSNDEVTAATAAGGEVVRGWCVDYTAPHLRHNIETNEAWTGYQALEEAYTLDHETAHTVGEWCCR